MDKLRALEYFVAAAEEGSFSAAARRLHVTPMAVSKLVSALEAKMAVSLFERHARGLSLTGSGASYLRMCQPGLAQLRQADEMLDASALDLSGSVVVGVQHVVAVKYLIPALPAFLLRFPGIQIDLRDFTLATEAQTRGIDVFLRMGWVDTEGLVMRRLATESFMVCATADYWRLHGIPQRPSDLRDHNCLLFRNALESTMDLWEFERADERESVVVRGQVIAGNAHVFAAEELGLAGVGVIRAGVLGSAPYRDRLVPVLEDWQSSFRPPVTLLYRSSVRRVPRVRRFIEFLEQTFAALQAQHDSPVPPGIRPHWSKRGYDKTSQAGHIRRPDGDASSPPVAADRP